MKDVTFRIVPLTRRDTCEMIREIKGYPLLEGYRGIEPANVPLLEEMLLKTRYYLIKEEKMKLMRQISSVLLPSTDRWNYATSCPCVVGATGRSPLQRSQGMMTTSQLVAYLWCSVLSVLLVTVSTSMATAQERVRAKIGVQVESTDVVTQAKAKSRLKAGDRLRIYVIPEADSYVYVIHSDQKKVTLVNHDAAQKKVEKNSLLVLPDADKYYQVDGLSSQESITVICSPTERTDLLDLLRSEGASHSEWAAIEETLIEKSKIDLGGKPEKPFVIAGNVRGKDDPFLKKLQTFSGKSLVVNRYEFAVKK